MTDASTFSVLIPAYNAASTIADTIDSLRAQTFPDWEACVVDDGSSDETLQIASNYAALDLRIRVWSQPNSGTASARNRAGAESRGRYLCLLDADDLYLPDYLAEQARFIEEHPGFQIYSCNADALLPDGTRHAYHRTESHGSIMSLTLNDMLEENQISSFSIFERGTFALVGGFRVGVYVEDYDFWLRAMAVGATHIHNPKTLVQYRMRLDNKSADWVTATESICEVLRTLVGSGVLRSSERCRALRTLRTLRRNEAILGRWNMEARMRVGQLRGARGNYLRFRQGYASPLKYYVGLPLMMFSPTLFALVVRRIGNIRASRSQSVKD
jgi:glycosyltransferase involved in cell wall biosynthesis